MSQDGYILVVYMCNFKDKSKILKDYSVCKLKL